MESRKVLGKRIVAAEHARHPAEPGRAGFTYVKRIVLEDGTVLVTAAYETECDALGDLIVVNSKDMPAAEAGLAKLKRKGK